MGTFPYLGMLRNGVGFSCIHVEYFAVGISTRTVGLMENGTWAPTAAKAMMKLLDGSKNLSFCENSVKILSALSDASRAQIEALAKELA